jgi:phosphohistidine phosphatase
LRHAKSAWDSDAPTDHERPLNKRGRRDAPRVAARIAELGWLPERVFSSDSMRARETWERMEGELGKRAKKVFFTRELFHAGLPEVQDTLAGVKDKVTTVLVIGHNPGWERC